MKRLDWRCVNSPGFVSEAITFISRGTVCHVEFLVLGQAIGAHARGGVLARPVDECPVDFRFSAQCTDEAYGRAITFLTSQIGKPYDFVDIAAILVNRNWRDPSKWICSELWAAVMEASGLIRRLDSSINLFTPQDALILSSAVFDRVAA